MSEEPESQDPMRKLLFGHPTLSPIEHWRKNLGRFPPGHIGFEYAREALARLDPRSNEEEQRK